MSGDGEEFVTYPAGLRLGGRRVVVVGGGHVAQRRIPALLAVGADVVLVSPQVTASLEGMSQTMSDELVWHAREYRPGDLDGAWYAIAATDDPTVNAEVVAEAEAARIFCVRADDASQGSAFTPAVGRHGEVTVAVLGSHLRERDPGRSAAIRDQVIGGLREGRLEATARRQGFAGVTLVGGGPGDPELVTVAGRRALMAADVVVADRLAPRELLGDLPDDVEVIDVAKLPRGRSTGQEQINALLVQHAKAGRHVVRFKGGDPFVFGRGLEEVQACTEAGVPVRVVPGLTTPVAVPGLAGVPVTHRGVAHEFTVVSGHVPPDDADSLVDWTALGRLRGTLVLMMAVRNAAAIADRLIEAGRAPDTPVAIVSEGSMPGERITRTDLLHLGEVVEGEEVRAPAIIVIGPVVALSDG